MAKEKNKYQKSKGHMATTRAKAVMLLTALLVAVAVYGVVKVSEYFAGCVTTSAETPSRAAPLFIIAQIDDLIRYSKPLCASPAFSASGEIWFAIQVVGYDGYKEVKGICASPGEYVSMSPDPARALSFKLLLENSNICIQAGSYYVYFHYDAYYS